jgi:hypothetical protein
LYPKLNSSKEIKMKTHNRSSTERNICAKSFKVHFLQSCSDFKLLLDHHLDAGVSFYLQLCRTRLVRDVRNIGRVPWKSRRVSSTSNNCHK